MISRVEPDGIVITFSGGIVKIPFTELSPEIQKKYRYTPDAAADFQQKAYQTDVVRARQIEEAQRKRAEENAKYWSEHPTPQPASIKLSIYTPHSRAFLIRTSCCWTADNLSLAGKRRTNSSQSGIARVGSCKTSVNKLI